MAFLDGHVQIHSRQFLTEGAHMELALDLTDARPLFFRPTWHQSPRCSHTSKNLRCGCTSGNHCSVSELTKEAVAVRASSMSRSTPYSAMGFCFSVFSA